MRKLILTLLFLFMQWSILQAQDKKKIQEEQNPFSEARFNYFKETIVLNNEYLDTQNGSYNTTKFRLLKPIGNRAWVLRFDAPLVSANTFSSNKTGLGDLSLSASFIPILSQKSGIATRLKLTANTASDSKFGQGKWIVAPAIFYGTFLDKTKKLLLISDLEYQYSIAGADDRSNVRVAVLENVIIYSLGIGV